MVNQNNIVVVWYPGRGLRVRRCKTTEYPDNYVKRSRVTPKEQTENFNAWSRYIRSQVDPNFDPGEGLLAEAKQLLIKQELSNSLKK